MAGRDRDYYRKRTHESASYAGEETLREPDCPGKREPFLDTEFSHRTNEFIAFDSRFVNAILGNMKVLMIGDSLMRGLYKDLITWTQTNHLSTDRDLKGKSEASYKGDRQIDISLLSDDKVFRQAREYQTENLCLQFHFTTRVMKDDMELLIRQMLGEDGYPDVILINSMIWDLTRYFKVSTDTSYSDCHYQKRIEIECMQKYLDRTSMFLRRLRAVLPPHTMVIWVCFPHCRPSENEGRGFRGMQNEALAAERNHFIRSVMIDGSFRVSQVVRSAGYDVLDIGFYMRNHAFYHYQKADGMHWLPPGVRLMSQLFIQFLAKSWGVDTSHFFTRMESKTLRKPVMMAKKQLKDHGHLSHEVPKIHDKIARNALKKMQSNDKYIAVSIIKKARTLFTFVQPPKITWRREKNYNTFARAEREDFVQKVRLTPFISRDTTDEIEDLTMELKAVSITAIEFEKKKQRNYRDGDERSEREDRSGRGWI